MVRNKRQSPIGRKRLVRKKKEIEDVEEGDAPDAETAEQSPPVEADETDQEPAQSAVPKHRFFAMKLGFGSGVSDAPARKPKSKIVEFFASVNNIGMGKQRTALIQSMAVMMNAGLPLIDTLHTLEREMRGRATKKIVRNIAAAVEAGDPLWQAMQDQYLFSPYEVALVRIGEEAGNLARNLEYLAAQQEKDHALKQKVKMAMIYPAIVLVLMTVIVMGLGMFVLPNLIQVLIAMKVELPVTTRAVIYVTNLFTQYGTVAVPSVIGGFIVIVLLSKFTGFRMISQWVVFRIPGIGALGREATIARFGVILGGLLRAGVPLVEALSSLENVTHIVAYKKLYGKMTQHITQGDSFSKTFSAIRGSTHLLPVSVQQLVVTGEQSGTLSETLLKIADIYEKKASETAEKLPIILEPMLLLFIGALVGTIAFAVITPIYSVVGNVGR